MGKCLALVSRRAQYVGDWLVCGGKTGCLGKRGKRSNSFKLLGDEGYRNRVQAEDRLDLVRGIAALKEIAAHAFSEKHLEIRLRLASERPESYVHEIPQGQRKLIFDDDSDDPQSCAAKSERVPVPGRQLLDAEQARERIELVGERYGTGDRPFGKPVAGEARAVMLLDRIGDFARLVVVHRVVASHDALQLRKFADHGGDQIGLG